MKGFMREQVEAMRRGDGILCRRSLYLRTFFETVTVPEKDDGLVSERFKIRYGELWIVGSIFRFEFGMASSGNSKRPRAGGA